MAHQDSTLKIKTLPRAGEKKAADSSSSPPSSPARPSKTLALAFIGLSLVILIVALTATHSQKPPAVETKTQSSKTPPVDRHSASINKYIHDSQMAELMMKRRLELENHKTYDRRKGPSALALAPDSDRNLGVKLDQENSAERVYEDLYGEKTGFAEGSPQDRISARLANRRWLNEMEKAERMTFVKNFIRQAYEQGYEVQLDQNLVVTSVKRISGPKVVNIDQVLERLAKQGQ